MTQSETLELADQHWLSSRTALAIRVMPAVVSLVTAVPEMAARPGKTSILVGVIAVLLSAIWVLVRREPYLIGSILCLGLDFAYVLKASTTASRVLLAVVAGLVLYLIHSLGSLSSLCSRGALIDRRVVVRWGERTAVIGLVGSLAGAAPALLGSAIRSNASILGTGARSAFGLVALGLLGVSLSLLWPSRASRRSSMRKPPMPRRPSK